MRPAAPGPVASDERQATGREKHDTKITVYLSEAELVDLEQARLALRRYGYVIDRGRLVREGIGILLADLDARGKDSLVARRVRASLDAGADGTDRTDRTGHNGAPHNGRGTGMALPGTAGDTADDADGPASPLPSLL